MFCSGSVFETPQVRIRHLHEAAPLFFIESTLTDPGLLSHDRASYLIFTPLFDACIQHQQKFTFSSVVCVYLEKFKHCNVA